MRPSPTLQRLEQQQQRLRISSRLPSKSHTRAPPLEMAASVSGSGRQKKERPPLPGTTLVLEAPRTKARVYIVGCVHGARASEEDVASVIEGRDAGVVVLVRF